MIHVRATWVVLETKRAFLYPLSKRMAVWEGVFCLILERAEVKSPRPTGQRPSSKGGRKSVENGDGAGLPSTLSMSARQEMGGIKLKNGLVWLESNLRRIKVLQKWGCHFFIPILVFFLLFVFQFKIESHRVESKRCKGQNHLQLQLKI